MEKNQKKPKKSSFDKAAEQLFEEYKKTPADKVIVTFNEDTIQMVENIKISYNEIERIIITKDLFIVFWNEKITVLQKKDLQVSSFEDFSDFIKEKSQTIFEIVDMDENYI